MNPAFLLCYVVLQPPRCGLWKNSQQGGALGQGLARTKWRLNNRHSMSVILFFISQVFKLASGEMQMYYGRRVPFLSIGENIAFSRFWNVPRFEKFSVWVWFEPAACEIFGLPYDYSRMITDITDWVFCGIENCKRIIQACFFRYYLSVCECSYVFLPRNILLWLVI